MEYGVIIKNYYGNTVIDGEYSNLQLIKSGQITASGGDWLWGDISPGSGPKTATITVSGKNPVIATRSVSAHRTFRIKLPDGRFRFHIYLGSISYPWSASPFQYFIYDNIDPIAASSEGMVIKRADGSIIYDAQSAPMKVLGFNNLTGIPYANQGSVVTPIASNTTAYGTSNLACINCLQSIYVNLEVIPFGEMTRIYATSYYTQGSTVVFIAGMEVEAEMSFPVYRSSNRATVLVIDTTNTPLNFN